MKLTTAMTTVYSHEPKKTLSYHLNQVKFSRLSHELALRRLINLLFKI